MAAWLDTIHQLRGLLTTGGRSLAQGALAYLWTEDPTVVPIPGFRSPGQIAELAGAVRLGPLPADVVAAVNTIRESARQPQPGTR